MHHLIVAWGYWAVVLLVAAESLGVPLPGETILVAAAIYAGTTHALSVWILFLVAAAAAIVGDNLGYLIGFTVGFRAVHRWGRYLRLDEARLKVGRYLFDRHGGKVVFFGRFVSVLRTYAAFLAGTNRMHWRHFAVANAAGGVVWAAFYTFVAYEAGSTLNRLSTTINVVLGVVAVVAVVVAVVAIRHQIGRLVERAEAAYPDPL